jgi:uncharacterized protein YndB with AHSA1/START domain
MGMTIGPLHVRRSILIRAEPARVWREFETFERFASWFGRGHSLESYVPAPNGEVQLSVEIAGVRRQFGGPVLVLEPGRELSYESNWHDPDMRHDVPMFHTLRLSRQHDGTLVEFFHHGFEFHGDAAEDLLQGYEEGWDLKQLSALREIVEQVPNGE